MDTFTPMRLEITCKETQSLRCRPKSRAFGVNASLLRSRAGNSIGRGNIGRPGTVVWLWEWLIRLPGTVFDCPSPALSLPLSLALQPK